MHKWTTSWIQVQITYKIKNLLNMEMDAKQYDAYCKAASDYFDVVSISLNWNCLTKNKIAKSSPYIKSQCTTKQNTINSQVKMHAESLQYKTRKFKEAQWHSRRKQTASEQLNKTSKSSTLIHHWTDSKFIHWNLIGMDTTFHPAPIKTIV